MLRGIRHDKFAPVFRIHQILQGFWRISLLDRALVIDNANDNVAITRSEVRVDRVGREIFSRGGLVLGKNAFLEHDLHRIVIGQNDVEQRPAGAVLA